MTQEKIVERTTTTTEPVNPPETVETTTVHGGHPHGDEQADGAVAGGAAGAVGRNWVERIDGSREDYGATFKVEMNAGDVLVVETPGGGGYGWLACPEPDPRPGAGEVASRLESSG
jgi:N-methylhydantoinase B/oxoprolinase/acetone carboxylase alpha subunit